MQQLLIYFGRHFYCILHSGSLTEVNWNGGRECESRKKNIKENTADTNKIYLQINMTEQMSSRL